MIEISSIWFVAICLWIVFIGFIAGFLIGCAANSD
jgi:hypothetical protein